MATTLTEIIELFDREAPGWDPAATVDTCKWGDPDAPVTAIAVTMMATPTVLERAHELGAQLVITHEPTFYDHLDGLVDELDDPVVAAKRKLLTRLGLTVWRCHDSIHKLSPDGITEGMIAALGWDEHRGGDRGNLFAAPAATLGELVAQVAERLGIAGLRWVGDPGLAVETVALSCGAAGWGSHRRLLRTPGVNVLICGEQREWETCEYVRDSNLLGEPCGLIVLGHVNSEEQGMLHLAGWLRARLPGIEVHPVPAGEPFRHT